MKMLLATLAIAYLGLAAWAHFTADRQIFLPPPPSYTVRDLPVVLVPADEGVEIAVLHLPNPEARYTLLVAHGNAEDLGYLLPLLARLRDAGFGVVAYDYRGYGASTGGRPTVDGTYRDADAAWRHAVETLGIAPGRLIAHGRSVGTGPATWLASEREVAGLVLESGFTSAFRVVTQVPILPFDRFPNLRRVRGLDVPVLVIHGRRDGVIPFRHGRQLYEAAPGPKQHLWVDRAGHNDLQLVAGERYFEALRAFAALLEEQGGPDGALVAEAVAGEDHPAVGQE